jgi:hypothetical protein
MGTCSEPFQVQIGLPSLIAKQAGSERKPMSLELDSVRMGGWVPRRGRGAGHATRGGWPSIIRVTRHLIGIRRRFRTKRSMVVDYTLP